MTVKSLVSVQMAHTSSVKPAYYRIPRKSYFDEDISNDASHVKLALLAAFRLSVACSVPRCPSNCTQAAADKIPTDIANFLQHLSDIMVSLACCGEHMRWHASFKRCATRHITLTQATGVCATATGVVLQV
jgi:hypothetical protein